MISESYYKELRYEAKRRGHEFSVSKNYLDQLLKNQKYQCFFSGRQLITPPLNHGQKRGQYNLSLDRLDPNKGYIPSNLAWVDKNINMSKQSLSSIEFIHLCRMVVEHNEP
jgi:hypothetical protein